MKKERVRNTFEGEVVSPVSVRFLGEEWDIPETDIAPGTPVEVDVEFGAVDLMDERKDGNTEGQVYFILYKGDRYHLTVKTASGELLYADTQDIWDKDDMVGIKILPEDIKLRVK